MVSEQTEPLRPDSARGVYGISIAADLAGVGVQTLRLYERHGLLTPARSEGGTRRYSEDDLTRLRRITTLAAAGVNIAGIGRILDLEDTVAELHAVNARLRKTYPGRSRKTEIQGPPAEYHPPRDPAGAAGAST